MLQYQKIRLKGKQPNEYKLIAMPCPTGEPKPLSPNAEKPKAEPNAEKPKAEPLIERVAE